MARQKCTAAASGILAVPAVAKIHRKVHKKMSSEWHWPVALWLPNLCTYVRIALCGKAFSVAFIDKKMFTVLYTFCFVANEMSRYFASVMNLTSALGDVLVHISSRISTTGLLLILSHVYRRDYKLVLLLLELDIASHWLRVYCEVMTKESDCRHLEKYQNFLYSHPVFRLVCAISQEVMYMSLYLVSFEWTEQGHPVKLDMKRLRHSKYFKSLAIAAPGYIMRQIAMLDEIRLATAMCLHFDAVPYCHEKVQAAVPDSEPIHVHIPTLPPRRRKRRSASRARNRSRSRFKFGTAEVLNSDNKVMIIMKPTIERRASGLRCQGPTRIGSKSGI